MHFGDDYVTFHMFKNLLLKSEMANWRKFWLYPPTMLSWYTAIAWVS